MFDKEDYECEFFSMMLNGYKQVSKHPKCLGDGIDDCGYNTKISCDECKFNNAPFGKKDPNAKCNQ